MSFPITVNSALVVLVEERVAGVGILLDVVVDPSVGERTLEGGSGAPQRAVLGAEAADDRAGVP